MFRFYFGIYSELGLQLFVNEPLVYFLLLFLLSLFLCFIFIILYSVHMHFIFMFISLNPLIVNYFSLF